MLSLFSLRLFKSGKHPMFRIYNFRPYVQENLNFCDKAVEPFALCTRGRSPLFLQPLDESSCLHITLAAAEWDVKYEHHQQGNSAGNVGRGGCFFFSINRVSCCIIGAASSIEFFVLSSLFLANVVKFFFVNVKQLIYICNSAFLL